MITEDTVTHVAKLARLALTPEETARYTQDLGKILHLVDELSELDLSGVADDLDAHLPTQFREDVPKQELEREALLSNAPREEEGFFRVPRILEEGS